MVGTGELVGTASWLTSQAFVLELQLKAYDGIPAHKVGFFYNVMEYFPIQKVS